MRNGREVGSRYADITLHAGLIAHVIDITVVNPDRGKACGRAVEEAESDKLKDDYVAVFGPGQFMVPFGLEATGRFGSHARRIRAFVLRQ